MNIQILLRIALGMLFAPLCAGSFNDLSWGEKELICHCTWDDSEEVTRLLALGVDPNCQRHNDTALNYSSYDPRNGDGYNNFFSRRCGVALREFNFPLAIAAENGNAYIAQLLVQAGANPHVHNAAGRTPLEFAIEGGNSKIIAILLQHGVEVNGKFSTGMTPLGYAVDREKAYIVRCLLTWGANPNITYLDRKATTTPLHRAARDNSVQIIVSLLEHKANIHALDSFGVTPLFQAAYGDSIEAMKILLHAGAMINEKFPDLGTPLAGAILAQKKAAALLLLQYGASIEPSMVNQRELYSFLSDDPYGSILTQDLVTLQQKLKQLRVPSNLSEYIRTLQQTFLVALGQKKWAAARLLLQQYRINMKDCPQLFLDRAVCGLTEAWRCNLVSQKKEDIATILWALQQGDIRRTYRGIMSCSQYPERYTIGALPVELLEHIIQATYPWISSEHMHALEASHTQQFARSRCLCCVQ